MSKSLSDRIIRNKAIEIEYGQRRGEREPSTLIELPSLPPEGKPYAVTIVQSGRESDGLAIG